MKQLTILSGAGINLGISATCPEATEIANFTYQKISASVYDRVEPGIKEMFSPESFDYILGGLLTINLAIDRTKEDLKRFKMNEAAFAELFRQSHLQSSIGNALDEIEEKLTVSLEQMISVVEKFNPFIDALCKKYDSINYFTLNFDGIFDHIVYGPRYSRSKEVTDFWTWDGKLNKSANTRIKIFHLHGDLRYKPTKKTKHHTPPYRWPVLVVGDQGVKKGIIASHEALLFYNQCFKSLFDSRGAAKENNLAIIGFGFREEDEHIIANIKNGLKKGVFDSASIYSPEDKLGAIWPARKWSAPGDKTLLEFIDSL